MKYMNGLIVCVCLAAVGVASAQAVNPMITEGTKAFRVSGSIDDDGDDIGFFFSGKAGYFPMDYVEAGAFLSFGLRGSDYKSFSLGGYGEYNFFSDNPLVPFVGASLGLTYWEYGRFDETFVEIKGYGGARYFFVDHAAVGADLALMYATEDIYNRGKDAFDWAIRLHTSWYFNLP